LLEKERFRCVFGPIVNIFVRVASLLIFDILGFFRYNLVA
jgi:hypothetical protein